jgi:hypothetical protein
VRIQRVIGWRALYGVATAVLLITAACSGASGEETVGQLRVCTEESFDSAAGACESDERAEALVSPAVYCSIEFVDHDDDPFAVETSFEGERVSSAEGTVDRDSGSLWVGVQTSNSADLPAGRWGCKLTLGTESLAASFRTGGESAGAAPLTQIACLTSEADGGECPAEAQARLFERPPSVTCSTLMVGLAGQRVRISVLRDGQETASYTTSPSQRNVQGAHGTVDPKLLEIEAGTVPPGEYACRFAVGDTPSWDVLFTVTD